MDDFFFDTISEPHTLGNELMSFDGLFAANYHNVVNNEVSFRNISFFEMGVMKMGVVLKHPAQLYFRGSLVIECIRGAVEMHGFTLKTDNKSPYLVISGFGQSAICLSTKEGLYSTNESDQTNKLNNKKLRELFGTEGFKQHFQSTVLILSRAEENILDMDILMPSMHISKISESYSHFQKAEEWLNCSFDVYSGNHIQPKMTYQPNLISTADTILGMEDPIVTICGGKGVGKSTALQYLVNRMFDKWESILVIDFDIGQPEFTIPGCVSVSLIENPLMGPNITRLCKPLRTIIIGHVNPEVCLTKCFTAINEFSILCQEIKNRIGIPWFINTMGYVKGFGLPLITKIISSFHPTHVVQINSTVEPNLNVFPLTPQNVSKVFENHPADSHGFGNYELIMFTSPNLRNAQFMPPRVARAIKIFSYLFANGRKELFLKRIKLSPKSGPETDCLKISKVVAISSSCTENVTVPCSGFGVIADRHDDIVYVLTPLAEEVLKSNLNLSVIEIGLQGLVWERLNFLKRPLTTEMTIKLGNKSKFTSGFLF